MSGKTTSDFIEETEINTSSEDAFGHEEYVDVLQEIIAEGDQRHIGIFGTWGSGKTSIVKTLFHERIGSPKEESTDTGGNQNQFENKNSGIFGTWGNEKISNIKTFFHEHNGSHTEESTDTNGNQNEFENMGSAYFNAWKHAEESIRTELLLTINQELSVTEDEGVIKERKILETLYDVTEDSEEESSLGQIIQQILKPTLILLFAFLVIALIAFILLSLIGSVSQFVGNISLPSKVGTSLIVGVLVLLFRQYYSAVTTQQYRTVEPRNVWSGAYERLFKKILNEAQNQYDEDTNVDQFIIAIDDIDRCRSSTVYDILVSLKTFLQVDGEVTCTYIIPCDHEALSDHVSTVSEGEYFADEVEQQNFLKKFFDIELYVPQFSQEDIGNYLEQRNDDFEDAARFDERTLEILSYLPVQTPRQVVRSLNRLQTMWEAARQIEQRAVKKDDVQTENYSLSEFDDVLLLHRDMCITTNQGKQVLSEFQNADAYASVTDRQETIPPGTVTDNVPLLALTLVLEEGFEQFFRYFQNHPEIYEDVLLYFSETDGSYQDRRATVQQCFTMLDKPINEESQIRRLFEETTVEPVQDIRPFLQIGQPTGEYTAVAHFRSTLTDGEVEKASRMLSEPLVDTTDRPISYVKEVVRFLSEPAAGSGDCATADGGVVAESPSIERSASINEQENSSDISDNTKRFWVRLRRINEICDDFPEMFRSTVANSALITAIESDVVTYGKLSEIETLLRYARYSVQDATVSQVANGLLQNDQLPIDRFQALFEVLQWLDSQKVEPTDQPISSILNNVFEMILSAGTASRKNDPREGVQSLEINELEKLIELGSDADVPITNSFRGCLLELLERKDHVSIDDEIIAMFIETGNDAPPIARSMFVHGLIEARGGGITGLRRASSALISFADQFPSSTAAEIASRCHIRVKLTEPTSFELLRLHIHIYETLPNETGIIYDRGDAQRFYHGIVSKPENIKRSGGTMLREFIRYGREASETNSRSHPFEELESGLDTKPNPPISAKELEFQPEVYSIAYPVIDRIPELLGNDWIDPVNCLVDLLQAVQEHEYYIIEASSDETADELDDVMDIVTALRRALDREDIIQRSQRQEIEERCGLSRDNSDGPLTSEGEETTDD